MWPNNRQNKMTIERRQRLQTRLDKIALANFEPAYTLSQQQTPTTPLVLNSPHSGNNYPPSMLAQSRLTLKQLRQSEDCYIDQIIEPLVHFNIPTIAANFPRIYLDLNRSPDEWPPELLAQRAGGPWPVTTRARSGLGVVPLRIGHSTDIYPQEITEGLIKGRIAALYHPYHTALRTLLTGAKHRFGHTLLLDCHSMPGYDTLGHPRPDIVLGDCHGKSCHPETIDFIETAFTALRYTVVRNQPYAGGYITSHYGHPAKCIEAVQIEINKNLYLDATNFEPHAGMAKLTSDFQIVVMKIKDYLNYATSLAAE